jgi:hypothetical protein
VAHSPRDSGLCLSMGRICLSSSNFLFHFHSRDDVLIMLMINHVLCELWLSHPVARTWLLDCTPRPSTLARTAQRVCRGSASTWGIAVWGMVRIFPEETCCQPNFQVRHTLWLRIIRNTCDLLSAKVSRLLFPVSLSLVLGGSLRVAATWPN